MLNLMCQTVNLVLVARAFERATLKIIPFVEYHYKC